MAKISPLMVAPPLIFGAFAVVGRCRNVPRRPQRASVCARGAVGTAGCPDRVSRQDRVFDDASLRDGEVKLVNFLGKLVRALPGRAPKP